MGGIISQLNFIGSPFNAQSRKYGWVRDKSDHRDIYHSFDHNEHPTRLDLLDVNIDVYDQGNLGSCTANAIAFAYQFDVAKQLCNANNTIFMPSRLYIYYNERDMEGSINDDAGASIRDGIKSINRLGVCLEEHWPYDIRKFKIKPPINCYEEGKKCHSIEYKRIDIGNNIEVNIKNMKSCINNGLPFVFGFDVFKSFEEVGMDGIMKMPSKDDNTLGGHAVVAIGYDDNIIVDGDKGVFIIRNSWGKDWGNMGHCYMPYKFIADPNYCADFWTVQKITIDNIYSDSFLSNSV